MDDTTLSAVCAKLDSIIRLMVLAMTEGKAQTHQVRLLSLAGFPPRDIAGILGTSANTVRVTLSKLKSHKSRTSGRGGTK